MTARTASKRLVVTVAARFREEQIRPFLASLAHYAPGVSLRLIVDKVRPEFREAVCAWIPDTSFALLPPAGLRDFALKRKWARSILKRLARVLPPAALGRRLLKINYVRHLVIRDLLKTWTLRDEKILLLDSRDLIFQGDPFAGDWPALWTGEEDRRIRDCELNSFWLNRAGGPDALRQAGDHRIVCAGVIGGTAEGVTRYIDRSSAMVERLASRVALDDGDQGIHNCLVRTVADLGFTVFPNGSALIANVGYTPPEQMVIEQDRVRLSNRQEYPAILHQFDRHPTLVELANSRWAAARPGDTLSRQD